MKPNPTFSVRTAVYVYPGVRETLYIPFLTFACTSSSVSVFINFTPYSAISVPDISTVPVTSTGGICKILWYTGFTFVALPT